MSPTELPTNAARLWAWCDQHSEPSRYGLAITRTCSGAAEDLAVTIDTIFDAYADLRRAGIIREHDHGPGTYGHTSTILAQRFPAPQEA